MARSEVRKQLIEAAVVGWFPENSYDDRTRVLEDIYRHDGFPLVKARFGLVLAIDNADNKEQWQSFHGYWSSLSERSRQRLVRTVAKVVEKRARNGK